MKPANGSILPPSFYQRSLLRVARELPGKYLVRVEGRSVLAGRIVEVEAYGGGDDPASHAFRGMTDRNEAMFRAGGILYVYFTYGMHHCANVVTGRAGSGSAVLIRALEPVAGMSRMVKNRKLVAGPEKTTRPSLPRGLQPRMVTGGPARLCQAMDIGMKQNGIALGGPQIFLVALPGEQPPRIGVSRRIGISAGKDKRWRFFIPGNDYLSRTSRGAGLMSD